MEAGSRVVAIVDQLLALFQQRSEDLPDGVFDRRTQFLLNGTPFEAMLGRPPSDPLVLLLARGPAGYRFTCKAILHAVPDAAIERGEIAHDMAARVARWQCWLSGHLRGTGESLETVFHAEFALAPSGVVERAAVTLDESTLAKIRAARLRP